MQPTDRPNRIPPYNTGKVLIGSRYEPPRRVEYSADAELLQAALIGVEMPLEARVARSAIRYGVWLLLAFVFAAMLFLMGFRRVV